MTILFEWRARLKEALRGPQSVFMKCKWPTSGFTKRTQMIVPASSVTQALYEGKKKERKKQKRKHNCSLLGGVEKVYCEWKRGIVRGRTSRSVQSGHGQWAMPCGERGKGREWVDKEIRCNIQEVQRNKRAGNQNGGIIQGRVAQTSGLESLQQTVGMPARWAL